MTRVFLNKLLLLFLSVWSAGSFAAMNPEILALQKQWAETKYQIADADQARAFKNLVDNAHSLTEKYSDSAEAYIWEGIIRATYAGVEGGVVALSEVKKAKACFEKAISIDPASMKGAAYTSLGSLYYQVPGWPISFGSDEQAEKYLKQGLTYDPQGIDANYFYGDFLRTKSKYREAQTVLLKALTAEARPDRPIADQGRKREIQQAIESIKGKLS